MPQFRKKPVVITAEQFTGLSDPPGVFRRAEDSTPYVVTIHDQRCYLSPGDWIVPEPDGVHYYPIKPDIFEATYERVANGGVGAVDSADAVTVTLSLKEIEATINSLAKHIPKPGSALSDDHQLCLATLKRVYASLQAAGGGVDMVPIH